MDSKNSSYDLTDILRFFSLSKNCSNNLHLSMILNDRNLQKPFELSLQTLQLLSLDIKSLLFSLELKQNDFIEELIIEDLPYFFLDYLKNIEYLQIYVPHDDFGLIPSVFELFKNFNCLKSIKLSFTKSNYYHLSYQRFIIIPLIDEFLLSHTHLRKLETNIYFLGSIKAIYPRLTHLTLEISPSLLHHELLRQTKNFPYIISLELYLTEPQSIIDLFCYQQLIELKESLQKLPFLTVLIIIQGFSQIILDNKRNEGLQKFIRELLNRPYLIEIKAEALDQIALIKYDENSDLNKAKAWYGILKKRIICQRVRFLSITQAFQRTKLKKTFKRPEILSEILNYLI